MTSVIDPPPAIEARSGMRAAIVVAVVGSAMAGLIHVAAVRTHDGDRTLAWMFGAVAVAQLAWAAAAAMRPARRVLILGAVINGGAVLVWAASRSVGIPFVDSLADPDAAGTQDLGAAVFAALAAVSAVSVLLRPVARVVITPARVGALAVFALLAAVPSLTADHTGHDGDDHLETAGPHDGQSAEEGETAAGSTHEDGGHDEAGTAGGSDDDHGSRTTGASGKDAHGEGHGDVDADLVSQRNGSTGTTGGHHGTTDTTGSHHGTTDTTSGNHQTSTTTGGHHTSTTTGGHHTTTTTGGTVDPPTGPIISLDDPRVTAAQRVIALRLISDARTALAAYPNVAAVEAAGYLSIGDGGTHGFEHYVKWSYLTDGIELNPSRVESIVVKKNGSAPKQIVSAMYILNLGKTMANTPALAGELTSWHLHDNLCFEGTSLVAIAVGGVCSRGTLLVTPPMLHVWLIPRPCGPFAGLEEAGETCETHAGH